MDHAETSPTACPWAPTSVHGRLHAAAVARRVHAGQSTGLAELYAIADVTRLARSHRLPHRATRNGS